VDAWQLGDRSTLERAIAIHRQCYNELLRQVGCRWAQSVPISLM
jgi:hypothetical protein